MSPEMVMARGDLVRVINVNVGMRDELYRARRNIPKWAEMLSSVPIGIIPTHHRLVIEAGYNAIRRSHGLQEQLITLNDQGIIKETKNRFAEPKPYQTIFRGTYKDDSLATRILYHNDNTKKPHATAAGSLNTKSKSINRDATTVDSTQIPKSGESSRSGAASCHDDHPHATAAGPLKTNSRYLSKPRDDDNSYSSETVQDESTPQNNPGTSKIVGSTSGSGQSAKRPCYTDPIDTLARKKPCSKSGIRKGNLDRIVPPGLLSKGVNFTRRDPPIHELAFPHEKIWVINRAQKQGKKMCEDISRKFNLPGSASGRSGKDGRFAEIEDLVFRMGPKVFDEPLLLKYGTIMTKEQARFHISALEGHLPRALKFPSELMFEPEPKWLTGYAGSFGGDGAGDNHLDHDDTSDQGGDSHGVIRGRGGSINESCLMPKMKKTWTKLCDLSFWR
ncbi:hypothetical protein OCU04_013197 [Sclerotinia nivalis]|uniref:Uncharacterized protein n=1 Tax=Sclerotinia nivalis TaxID=352851 RepID=A0A9X0DEN0_9HELO|nr:hypothetical protein OCU04_013197 [Sclerotinia nivalis]